MIEVIDPLEHLMRYEAGELEPEEIIDLFQYLIDIGMIWHLQGSYQRMAQHLIAHGLCTAKN